MAEEYTWAQIASQVGAVLNQHRSLIALHEMMSKAAAVEAYLADHEAEAARIDEALDAQRALLVESAEAYKELLEAIQAEKHQHAVTKRDLTRAAKAHETKCKARMDAASDLTDQKVAQMEAATKAHCADMQEEQDIATDVVEVIYAALEVADQKLAALRESL